MAPSIQTKTSCRPILLKDLNPCITCSLCSGYLIDATSLIDCCHVFCRACILRYFENFKLGCPKLGCNVVYKKKNSTFFRPDPTIQSLVYKLVPGLYSKEVQRREDFYRSTGVRASSSCSEDSVLGDLNEEREEWMLSTCSDQNQYLSPDDAVSLSLEYYQPHLDTTQNQPSNTKSTNSQDSTSEAKPSDTNDSANLSAEKSQNCDNSNTNASAGDGSGELKSPKQISSGADEDKLKSEGDDASDTKKGDRRYLQCPAAVTMSHLQKFLRMKYALNTEHKVDIIHSGEVLPSHFSLMDVAYTFKWKRDFGALSQKTKPMRFFYRIFSTAKIQPIKIISTSSMGGKQLQVVPAKPNSAAQTHTIQPAESKSEATKEALTKADADAQNYRNKERLMANLELQSKTKALEKPAHDTGWRHQEKNHKTKATEEETDCVFEYEEPDEDELKAFAEKRDREWALQKQLDEEKEKHRTSKKRKKSKHSKNNLLYKKRKLHAEITSSESLQKEESLKLKVKLTTPHNGYKHKHHKSSQNQVVEPPPKAPELSSKEKLLQMRQVRHKHISVEDKTKTHQNTTAVAVNTEETPVKTKDEAKVVNNNNKVDVTETKVISKPVEVQKKQPEIQETHNKSTQSTPSPSKPAENSKVKSLDQPKQPVSSGKTLRSDFSIKTSATKELCMQKYPTVQLERNEQTERQAQKTFLKTFQSYTEKFAQSQDKNPAPKIRPAQQNTYARTSNFQTTKSLEQKIANLQQQCTTVEAKPAPASTPTPRQDLAKVEKKLGYINEKPRILNSHQYPSGFTVSKIEAGAKRKYGNEANLHDKRPSLEITLINPPNSEFSKPAAKRPPPPTIPLDRIKKSMNRMSGVSIIPKMPGRCDNSGALDLSKPSKSSDATPKTHETPNKILNGMSLLPRPAERGIQLSNLQMLSKVAAEHSTINKPAGAVANKRPPMPNLQTLKIPVPQNSSPKSNLAKLPKLNEISKTQFRMPNPQLRNMRPNQSQSVRNIPNPSLLVRQQNQNRLNSLNCSQNSGESKDQPKQNSSNSDSTKKSETSEKADQKEPAKAEVEIKASS